mgnify:CR=1 FL=1
MPLGSVPPSRKSTSNPELHFGRGFVRLHDCPVPSSPVSTSEPSLSSNIPRVWPSRAVPRVARDTRMFFRVGNGLRVSVRPEAPCTRAQLCHRVRGRVNSNSDKFWHADSNHLRFRALGSNPLPRTMRCTTVHLAPHASAPRRGFTGAKPAILATRRLTPMARPLPAYHQDPSRRWPALVAPPLAIARAAAPSARHACVDGLALH